MKRVISFLLILSFSAAIWAYSFEMDLTKIRGVTAAYSGRAMLVFGTKTGEVFFPMHLGYLGLVGFGDLTTSESRAEGVFGGIGFLLGFSALDREGNISGGNYYCNDYRLLRLNTPKKQLMLIGGNIRIVSLLPFSAESGALSSYFQLSIEAGVMNLDYEAESGAFNLVEKKTERVSSFYLGFVPGFKFLFFSVDFGLGALFDFYQRSLSYDLPDKEDREISNLKDPTVHFLLNGSLGLTIDLCSLKD